MHCSQCFGAAHLGLYNESDLLLLRTWKELTLDDTITEYQRSQLAVWDYPITDKFTKMWKKIEEEHVEPMLPNNMEEALERIHNPVEEEEEVEDDKKKKKGGFALIGEMIIGYCGLT